MTQIDPRLEAESQAQKELQGNCEQEPQPDQQEDTPQEEHEDSQGPPSTPPQQKSKRKRKYELHDSPSRAEIRGAELFRKHLVAEGAIRAHQYSRTYLFDFFNIPRSSGHRILKLPTARQFAHGDGNVETRGRKRKPKVLTETIPPPPQQQQQQQILEQLPLPPLSLPPQQEQQQPYLHPQQQQSQPEQHLQQAYETGRMMDHQIQ